MNELYTCPSPGTYKYHYPTFADAPQQLCIHLITPDQQRALVSYPNHRNFKAPHLIKVTWFRSVVLEKISDQLDRQQPEGISQSLVNEYGYEQAKRLYPALFNLLDNENKTAEFWLDCA